jgi:ABC-type transport system involved in cytochrome c biogenesis permease subunit
MNVAKIAPWAAAGLVAVSVGVALRAPHPVKGHDVAAFGRLPVLEGGRVKPIDSVARNSLLMIRTQQSFQYEDRTISADEWLLDVMFRPARAADEPVFNIDDPDVLGLLGMQQTKQRYFSFRTLAPRLAEIQKQAQVVQAIEAKDRTRFQGAVATLWSRVYLYYQLANTVQLISGEGGLQAELASAPGPETAQRRAELSDLAHFRPLLPPAGDTGDGWRSVGQALRARDLGEQDPGLDAWARLSSAWAAQDPFAFNGAVAQLGSIAATIRPAATAQASHELVFNRAQPFYLGMVFYVLALLAVFASWAWKPEVLRPVAFSLLVSAAVIHTAGLVSRVILQGRPPVTNLYSSAVFVGWGAVVVGVVLERMYRKGFGTVAAAAAGFGSLIVAHHLSGDGDTMEMMRAVLDSNFWLATHVVTITIGYSGAFLAGIIAIGWVIRRHVVANPDPSTSKALVGMAYGVICFALFFSFVGTVLGGIWADQSWGRFWGWDPKENGALLIVLWNAIILHARWGGFVRDRGIMTMAIFGNVITSLSWFGVNMLGVGLHSYGFMDKAFWALFAFIGTQLAIMALALAPPMFWRAAARAPAAAGKGGARGAPGPA